jgi:sensor histidine kinase YesM
MENSVAAVQAELGILPERHQVVPGALRATSSPKIRFNGILAIGSIAAALALTTAAECHSVFYPPSLLYGFVLWGWWGVIGSVLWKLGPRLSPMLRSSPATIAIHLLLGTALGVIHLLLLGSLGFIVSDWKQYATAHAVLTTLLNLNRFGIEILIYGFVFGIIGIVQVQVRAQRDAMRSLELEKQLSAAHLQALQMQMEPHFLFNTLNAITTLVEFGRQKEASEMLAHLNAILKSTLTRTTPEKVPLSQELEMVENYLAIEQVRFADRLRIEMKVDPSALDGLVPCFLLQPIVENAIRHGIARCENEGKVETSALREGGFLHLLIRDSGPGLHGHTKPGHGIGLKNTKERLAHFYQDYEMKAGAMETGGFEVAIRIPYERDKASSDLRLA